MTDSPVPPSKSITHALEQAKTDPQPARRPPTMADTATLTGLLDERALDAACVAFLAAYGDPAAAPKDYRREIKTAIAAYLSSVPAHVPVEVEGLIEFLEKVSFDSIPREYGKLKAAEAASALRTLSAERDALAKAHPLPMAAEAWARDQARIATAEAQLAEAKAERDAWKKSAKLDREIAEGMRRQRDDWRDRATAAEAQLAEAKAERDALRKALEPFGSVLKGNWSHQPDAMPMTFGFGQDLRLELTLGDFRRARASLAALASAKPAQAGEVDRLTAERDEAVKALEPFAKAAGIKLCGDWRDDQRIAQTDASAHITFGHIRAAAAVYASTRSRSEPSHG